MLNRITTVEVCDPNTSVGAGARDDDSSNADDKIKRAPKDRVLNY